LAGEGGTRLSREPKSVVQELLCGWIHGAILLRWQGRVDIVASTKRIPQSPIAMGLPECAHGHGSLGRHSRSGSRSWVRPSRSPPPT
jgi:hypothetical protein